MIRVKITNPITWHDQCDWIYKNCIEYTDETNWSAWQIGIDDIFFSIPDEDAVVFNLLFKNV